MADEAIPIYLSNTLGHELERFESAEPGVVRMYTCGPTVYSYAHIGNFRSFMFADTLRRMLEYNGYNVQHARNITDVGHLTDETLNTGLDRIERAARERNISPWDIAEFYTNAFLEDARRLNLKVPEFTPRATQYVQQMIELTQRLIDRGYAYPAGDNVYFDVSRFPQYGRLSGNTVDQLIAGARVEVGEDKRSPADFALWKAAGPEKLMRWKSPWGWGVPGWHIECSAMSMTLLGEHLDIHTGGTDNIFPHHEDEIAQSEGATGLQFARYWLHGERLQLAEEKMSKSLGNVYTISDLLERGYHPLSYRYFSYQAHYRTPLTFSFDALGAAQTALYRLWETAAEMRQSVEQPVLGEAAEAYRRRFHEAINRDLDMPGALAVVHEALGARKLPAEQKLALLHNVDEVLSLDIMGQAVELSATVPQQEALLAARADARAAKDWARADALRAELAAAGLEVRDTPGGQRWVRRDLLPHPGNEAEERAG